VKIKVFDGYVLEKEDDTIKAIILPWGKK